MELKVGERSIIIEIEYGKRKKTVLSIEPSGFVKVKAPKGTDEGQLLKAIEDRGDWILEQIGRLAQITKPAEAREPKRFLEGDEFLYKGKAYPIEIIESPEVGKNAVTFNGNVLCINAVNTDEDKIRDALQRFYIRECRQTVLKRIAFYQPQFKVKPSSVEVKDTPTKWGQCSSERRMVFNWKLIMAPPEALDYVVVHEMCHLVHMNHDRSFWRLVGKIMPNHDEATKWLERYGHEMTF